jgi:GNAT superfamily N-acetyltransferase
MKYLKTFEEISFLKNIFKRKTGEVIIRPMKKSDVQKCLDLKFQYFGHFYGDVSDPNVKKSHDQYALNKLDLSVSLVAEVDGKIVGGYILKKTGLPNYPGNFYDFSGDNSKGVEGVSLFVHPDYKSSGIGHKLKYYYKENKNSEVSFIWGMAFHGLNNMKHWLKTRTMFNDMFDVYYTIEFYDPNGLSKYPKTKYLEFYEKTEMSITDFISEGVENGQDIEDLFEEVLEYVDIDIQELRNLAKRFNYLKEE